MPAPSSSSTRRGNDDNDNHNADDPYRDFLVRREVWPKAHSVQLREHYDPSSTEDLAAERATRSSHRPLGGSVTSPHRAAGTSGAAYPHHHHPDDFEQEGLERVLHEKHAGGWTESLSEEQREQLLRCVKDAGRPEDVREDYKRLLDNPDIVLSARTVHQMTPDFQRIESHRRMHGWARYILPVSPGRFTCYLLSPSRAVRPRLISRALAREHPADRGGGFLLSIHPSIHLSAPGLRG